MPTRTALINCIVIASCFLAGCTSGSLDGMDGMDGMEEPSAAPDGVAPANRLSMNRLSMNSLSLASLSTAPLSPDGSTLTKTDLLDDAAGRELLRYITRCALTEGTKLVATVGSETYEFEGAIGLAPKWLGGLISFAERRWVSACLLAHVNGYGVEVPISLRGNHPALVSDKTERESFPEQEVSFYGNVFDMVTPGDAPDIHHRMYSCGGKNLQVKCGKSENAFRPSRSCEEGTDCALGFVGPCRDMTAANLNACDAASSEGYERCRSEVSVIDGKLPDDIHVYAEVITVYLAEKDFSSFYPTCVSP